MTVHTQELLEVSAFGVSFLALVFATLVLGGAYRDWQDARAAGVTITDQASEIAKERVVTGFFLFWMAACLSLSSVYSMVLLRNTALWADTEALLAKYAAVQLQAFVLRAVWRISVLGFAFVRWSTRERIRRERYIEMSRPRDTGA